MAMTTTTTKLRARADALDEQARALRLAAYFLDEEAAQQKRGTLGRTLSGAIALRAAQKNGHGPTPEQAPAPSPKRRSSKKLPPASWKATMARRKEKREQLLAIVRAYGKPMPITKLAAAARKQGLGPLTGISGTVRAGYLKATGRRGHMVSYSVPASASPRPA